MRYLPKYAFYSFFVVVATAFPSFAQSGNSQLVDKKLAVLEKTIADLKKSIVKLQSDTTKITPAYTELNDAADKLSSDFLELKSGGVVLKSISNIADVLAERLDALNKIEAGSDEAREAIVTDTDKLFTAIVETRLGAATKRRNSPHKFSLRLLNTLSAELAVSELAEEEKKATQKLQAQLPQFYENLALFNVRAESTQNSPTLVKKITELNTLLQTATPEKFKALKGAEATAVKLSRALRKVSEKVKQDEIKDKVDSITKNAKALTADLTGSDKAVEKTALLKALLLTPGATEALTALQTRVTATLVNKPKLVVRVAEAKYGDTPIKRWIPKRWCDATAYMREKCNRQNKCPALDDKYRFNVCGYDPAPSAEPGRRGLYVRYVCVPNIDANFVGAYPANAIGAKRNPTLSKGQQHYVVLRAGGTVQCSAG